MNISNSQVKGLQHSARSGLRSLYRPDPELTPAHFSLLSPSNFVISDDEPDDNTLMTAAEGITGGIRYGPAD
ncbi:TPA: hypothetical protein OMT56_004457 [Enterobacter roggenkampii]|nr:hypothetical protein [Enterobacter roggenkampii]